MREYKSIDLHKINGDIFGIFIRYVENNRTEELHFEIGDKELPMVIKELKETMSKRYNEMYNKNGKYHKIDESTDFSAVASFICLVVGGLVGFFSHNNLYMFLGFSSMTIPLGLLVLSKKYKNEKYLAEELKAKSQLNAIADVEKALEKHNILLKEKEKNRIKTPEERIRKQIERDCGITFTNESLSDKLSEILAFGIKLISNSRLTGIVLKIDNNIRETFHLEQNPKYMEYLYNQRKRVAMDRTKKPQKKVSIEEEQELREFINERVKIEREKARIRNIEIGRERARRQFEKEQEKERLRNEKKNAYQTTRGIIERQRRREEERRYSDPYKPNQSSRDDRFGSKGGKI